MYGRSHLYTDKYSREGQIQVSGGGRIAPVMFFNM